MWLRHALKLLLPIIIFSACSSPDRQAVDKLNSVSYAYHYRNIDSTEYYAQKALSLAADYPDGKAEALNNLAFVRIVQMRYDEARRMLDQIPQTTDNQIELLVSYIQQMRLCQRMSQNRAFYDYREQAISALRRIGEERTSLDPRQQARMVYAESEIAIVNSTYYYYVGLERQSAEALKAMPANLASDTVQYLNYLYNVGAGGMITSGTQEEINQVEFDYLLRCFLLSVKANCPYFSANSLEALAEHLMNTDYREQLMADNLPAFKYINPADVATDSLPVWLADEALCIFTDYGDVYQIAGALRTVASCYRALGDNQSALFYLEQALKDTIINQAPDLVASIREQLSVAYAAIDDKSQSDLNRNYYLELQEQTRQDRSLEARAGQLEQNVTQLNRLLLAIGITLALLAIVLVVVIVRHKHRRKQATGNEENEREDELREQLALARLHVESAQRRNLEQRAKISLVNSITPFIDRMIHEVKALEGSGSQREGRLEYICELTDKINEQNDILTHWIQLRQGELSLHIETFALQQLFDIVAKGKMGFRLKNVSLEVKPTDCRVKADRVLTLFMLNTLADNARKFTAEGGTVTISAEETADYVEISVSDTGIGMTDDELAHAFERKIITDDREQTSHGFGLLNCKGIIEKYRKLSQIFSVCLISAESSKGQGSRFFFRLPKGASPSHLGIKAIAWIMGLMTLGAPTAQAADPLTMASAYADSAYASNINGNYERALSFADSCRQYLNQYYHQERPHSTDTLLRTGDPSAISPEVNWLHDNLRVNYDILLIMRNESAVAALALHEWSLYQYNNRIFTQLFKELSADSTLDDYCRKMQQTQTNRQIAIILLVLLFVVILLAVAWQVVRALGRAARRQQEQQAQQELIEDEITRTQMEEGRLHVSNAVLDNCLSSLKHETMYYPSRIQQLTTDEDTTSLQEVAVYYRELYGILSQQAMRQLEHQKLHLQRLEHNILGDPILIRYLFELLRKQSGERQLNAEFTIHDEKYVVCTVPMPQLRLTEEQAAQLFTPSADRIPWLLCRQIVRDHGEATNRRACAIRAELNNGITHIIITLPAAKGMRNEEWKES